MTPDVQKKIIEAIDSRLLEALSTAIAERDAMKARALDQIRIGNAHTESVARFILGDAKPALQPHDFKAWGVSAANCEECGMTQNDTRVIHTNRDPKPAEGEERCGCGHPWVTHGAVEGCHNCLCIAVPPQPEKPKCNLPGHTTECHLGKAPCADHIGIEWTCNCGKSTVDPKEVTFKDGHGLLVCSPPEKPGEPEDDATWLRWLAGECLKDLFFAERLRRIANALEPRKSENPKCLCGRKPHDRVHDGDSSFYNHDYDPEKPSEIEAPTVANAIGLVKHISGRIVDGDVLLAQRELSELVTLLHALESRKPAAAVSDATVWKAVYAFNLICPISRTVDAAVTFEAMKSALGVSETEKKP